MGKSKSLLSKRTTNNNLSIDHIKFFYSVVLLVENDDVDRAKGYDWGHVKRTLKPKIAIVNDTRKNKIEIPENISDNSIYFRECDSVAWSFLKHLRHAFAHNYISYDESSCILTVKMPNYNRSSIKLYCKITFDNLMKVVNELKKKRTNKTKRK